MSRTRFRKLLPLVSTLALILPVLLALASPVSAATITVCASGCDHTTIQAAVDAANDGDVIDVYPNPSTYNESVDLNGMSPDGDITIRSVNSGGTPTAGTVTVDGGTSGPAFETSSTFSGDVTIDGFIVKSTNDDGIYVAVNSGVVIRDVTANGTGEDGIHVGDASGNVTVKDCTANENGDNGFDLDDIDGNLTVTRCTGNDNDEDNFDIDNIGGNVTITNSTANRSDEDEGFNLDGIGGNVKVTGCTANDNHQENFEIDEVDGNVTVRRCTANGSEEDEGIRIGEGEDGGIGGDVKITDCTANDNDDGFEIDDVDGNVSVTRCTANGNQDEGIDIFEVGGDTTVEACVALDNSEDGVDVDELNPGHTNRVNGSIICGNVEDGLEVGDSTTDFHVNAEGNWWGCPTGPGTGACDDIEVQSGTVDETPWVDTITASAPASVIVGEPAIVSFQFSGGPPAVYLGEGPGDLHGDPTFVVSTDNGTVTGGFINAPHGVMEVTLVPQTEGTATVTVVGPCGLDEQIVLGVQAAGADFVPEPASVMLLASGLMGLAGYAGLRMRRK